MCDRLASVPLSKRLMTTKHLFLSMIAIATMFSIASRFIEPVNDVSDRMDDIEHALQVSTGGIR